MWGRAGDGEGSFCHSNMSSNRKVDLDDLEGSDDEDSVVEEVLREGGFRDKYGWLGSFRSRSMVDHMSCISWTTAWNQAGLRSTATQEKVSHFQ